MTFVRFVRYENAMRPLNIYERRVVFARNVSMDGKEWLSSLDREIICEKREPVVFAKSTAILSAAQNGSQQPKFKPWWRQVEALGTVQWRPLAVAAEGI